MPFMTIARREWSHAVSGCAFCSVTAPCVAQRVCPSPVVDTEPFVPAAVCLRVGQPREVCLLAWHLGEGAEGAPEVSGEIAAMGGTPLPLRVESPKVVADPDGFARYLVTLTTPAAPRPVLPRGAETQSQESGT